MPQSPRARERSGPAGKAMAISAKATGASAAARAYAADYDVVDELDAIVTGLLARGTRSASGAPAG